MKRAPSTHGTQTGSLASLLGFSNGFEGKEVQGSDVPYLDVPGSY